MVEEQSHDHVGESDIGGENFVSSMNQQSQQSTPSENSQRKRKRAVGSSSEWNRGNYQWTERFLC